ncbi:hypothetical protein R6Z07F_017986 [Ovis aries]
MRVPAGLGGGAPKLLGRELAEGACALEPRLNPGICAGAVQSARERRGYSTLPIELKQPSSSFDDLDSHKSSKVNAIIMFCIGGAILLAMLILMAVVICLYYKVANALNMPKVPVCLALKNNPAMVSPDKVSAALTTGSYPTLQCCDECNLGSDLGFP